MKAKDWYLQQSPRDRLIVSGIAILVVIGLLYAMVIAPFNRQLQQRQTAVASKQKTLSWMLESEAQVNSIRGVSGVSVAKSNTAPYLLVDQTIRKFKMSNPDRVEPVDKTAARVQFSEVEFDKLIRAIGEWERVGLKVSSLNISRKSKGMVSARLKLDKSL